MFKKNKKKIIIGIIVVVAIVIGVVYYKISTAASIKYIPSDFTSKDENLNMVGIQDSIDLCIYQYDSSSSIEKQSGYTVMDQEDVEEVKDYFNNYLTWLDSDDLTSKCNEALECISVGDYYMVSTKEGEQIGDSVYGKYDNYSVWFYDLESNKLYYIHENI